MTEPSLDERDPFFSVLTAIAAALDPIGNEAAIVCINQAIEVLNSHKGHRDGLREGLAVAIKLLASHGYDGELVWAMLDAAKEATGATFSSDGEYTEATS